MSVLSVVQEIWKQPFNRFDLVNLFNFRFQAKSETTRGETTFVFRNKPQSQKKVSRKQKEKAYFNSKVGLFEKRCLPNQWQWCFHLCNPVRVCPLMARWLRMDYFGMKAETIVACFPQAFQNLFWLLTARQKQTAEKLGGKFSSLTPVYLFFFQLVFNK